MQAQQAAQHRLQQWAQQHQRRRNMPNVPGITGGADLAHVGNWVAGRAGLQAGGHTGANEPKGSQSRMSGKEVETYSNHKAGGGIITRGGGDYSAAREARKDSQ
jgi:hypothetical protein